MLVLQQVKVLPRGARIIILDCDNKVASMQKGYDGNLLIHGDASDAERYYKIYATFRVAGLKAVVYKNNMDRLDLYYLIQVREGFDNESEGAACSNS